MGEVVRNGNLTESKSSSVSLFFPVSLLLPYPPKQPFWQLQGMLFSQARSATQSMGRVSCSTLLEKDCFKIFTQETQTVFSNDSEPLLPKPWGAQSRCRAGLCSCVFTASHPGLHQSIREPCLHPVFAHWWPVQTQRVPAWKGVWDPRWGWSKSSQKS